MDLKIKIFRITKYSVHGMITIPNFLLLNCERNLFQLTFFSHFILHIYLVSTHILLPMNV